MKLSEIQPISALKAVLVTAGVTETIYEGGSPTSALPSEYIEILQNGSFKTPVMKMGIITGVLLVSINVKLLANDSTNQTKETLILKKLDSLFEDNKIAVSGKYHFSTDADNLVYGGRGISRGYSTRIINLLVKIY